MFAVPGWSVSTKNLKVERKSSDITSKKRKRPSAEDAPLDTKEIGDLWKKHIETQDNQNEQDSTTETRVLPKKEKKSKKLKHSSPAPNEDLRITTSNDKHEKTKHRTNDSVNDVGKPPKLATDKTYTSKKASIVPTSLDLDKHAKQQQPGKDDNAPGKRSHAGDAAKTSATASSTGPMPSKTASKLTPLQASMRQKLISSRFRYLNETLYTTPSASSLELFRNNPEFFAEYHEGFRRQVEAWPENPVDSFLGWINERGPIGMRNHKKMRQKTNQKQADPQNDAGPLLSKEEPLPRDLRRWVCNIADLGCGDGKLGSNLTSSGLSKKLRLNVHSFDLVSNAPHIQVADIRSLPLEDSSFDVAIFCLALMGTNWVDFVEEAYRILRWKGECWIAEVTSRFAASKASRVEHSVGNRVKSKQKRVGNPENRQAAKEEEPEDLGMADDAQSQLQTKTDVSAFAAVLRRRGFILQDVPQTGNKMFVLMRFVKALPPRRGKNIKQERMEGKKKFLPEGDEDVSVEDEAKVLKPCVYKLR